MTSGKRVADQTLRLSITLPSDVAEGVKGLARRRRVPMGAVLRELVVLGLERQLRVERIADVVDPVPAPVAV